MTRKEFDAKLNELISQIPDLIKGQAQHYIVNGAIDLDDYENDFILPKAVLCAALAEVKFQFHPLSDEGRKLVKNLEHF
jgi:hypothetical protein